MTPSKAPIDIVKAGDRQGLGVIYDSSGSLITHTGEKVLKILANWDMDVMSPWRRVLPKTIFSGFHGRAKSALYVTSSRIVLLREIDEWRELAGDLTPLGLPNAAAKERRLADLRRAGIRQFCQLLPEALTLVSLRKYGRRICMLDMKLLGIDRRQYAVMIWKTDGRDNATLEFLESRFRRGSSILSEESIRQPSGSNQPRH